MYLAAGIPATGFGWANVSALGDLTLALVPNRLPHREQRALRQAIVSLADQRIAKMEAQGYPVPYLPADGRYSWGSNSDVLNQIELIAAAFDLTSDPRYRRAAFEAMDYILGRNGLNQSYAAPPRRAALSARWSGHLTALPSRLRVQRLATGRGGRWSGPFATRRPATAGRAPDPGGEPSETRRPGCDRHRESTWLPSSQPPPS